MRVVIQRVTHAQVEVDSRTVGAIGPGLLVLLSVTHTDTEQDARFIAEKLVNLRIFPDDDGKMNRSVQDIRGKILLVSQFTLHGDCRKGRRPGFDQAAPPDLAQKLYNLTADMIRQLGTEVETGTFAAHMHVSLLNDGPVTFLLDSAKLF